MNGLRLHLGVVAVVLTLSAACARAESDTGDASEPAVDATMLWRSLGSWSGSGDRQTESFDITSGALRLVWEAGGEATRGRFRVALHSAISGRPLEAVVEAQAPGSDTVRIGANPRVAYLRIEADAPVDWTITLEEGVAASTSR